MVLSEKDLHLLDQCLRNMKTLQKAVLLVRFLGILWIMDGLALNPLRFLVY
ncbi:hypothetical protein sync_0931 [Synechococcus sp. CC9311]|nr:hypothetical protein sync_0931 [Synechococcus sp. CC9311]